MRVGNLLLGTNGPYLLSLAVELGSETDIFMLQAPSPPYYVVLFHSLQERRLSTPSKQSSLSYTHV